LGRASHSALEIRQLQISAGEPLEKAEQKEKAYYLLPEGVEVNGRTQTSIQTMEGYFAE